MSSASVTTVSRLPEITVSAISSRRGGCSSVSRASRSARNGRANRPHTSGSSVICAGSAPKRLVTARMKAASSSLWRNLSRGTTGVAETKTCRGRRMVSSRSNVAYILRACRPCYDRTVQRAADHCRRPIPQSTGPTAQVCVAALHRSGSPCRGAGLRPFRFQEGQPRPRMQRRSHRLRHEPDSRDATALAGEAWEAKPNSS